MKKRIFHLCLWLFFGASMNVAASFPAPDFRPVPWDERTYKAVLSHSFGDVTVNVHSQGDGKVESILIEAIGREILVPLEQLIGIEKLKEAELSVQGEGSEREELHILFEYGFPIHVQGDSDSYWARSILKIAIDRKGKVEIAKIIPGVSFPKR